jgi:uncharacterized membrane protein
MAHAAAYVTMLVVFGIFDAVWLTVAGKYLYRPTLGDILLADIRYAPAIVFYLMFPLGVLLFGSLPAVRSGALVTALSYGALFGAFAYATYDLTNYATLRNWTLHITLIDIAYGAIVCSVMAAAGFLTIRAING